ncbi:BTAD domain-containing putative transcriptional regulator [Dactylosporangium sp. CA-152071]|uniref:AfsR/SARP family transcriptional regulator n=1 Tax=Dactylosporangium sp. CA-152071 TaxID=3239933 RepID=UPI003D8F5947
MDYRVLGLVGAWLDGRPVPVSGTKPRTVLAALVLAANEPVSADRLIDVTWGPRSPASAQRILHQYISKLRGLLPPGSIERHPVGYVLRAAEDDVDVLRFERLAREGREALRTGDAAAAEGLLTEALAQWQGPVLGGVTDELIVAARPALDQRHAAALADRVDAGLATGRHHELLPEIGRLVAQTPLDERLRGQLILALYRADRRADALAAYTQASRLLRTELGIDPGPALRRLHQRILTDDPTLATAGAPQQRSEHRKAVKQEPPTPRQLPVVGLHFVGRGTELAQLDDWLAADTDGPATVVISGMAGSGKTSLAVWWGRRAAGQFPDGQLYLNLRGFGAEPEAGPAEALGHLLTGLGVPHGQIPADVPQAASLFRSVTADRRLLMVLDNARSAEQVRPLLPGGAGVKVLVTSRERLLSLAAVEGARSLPVAALAEPDAVVLVTRMVGAERAVAEPAAVTELVRHCGGLPLALRIAAVDLPVGVAHPIAERAGQLAGDARLPALRTRDDADSAVTAAFRHSYSRLGPATQQVFRLLGLLPAAEFDGEVGAAASRLPAAEVAPLLVRLTDANLLSTVRPGRYAMHDLLREFAAALAAATEPPGRREAATRRAYQWYVDRCRAAAARLAPNVPRADDEPADRSLFPEAADARAWLAVEYPNLCTAALAAPGRGVADMAWRLAVPLRVPFMANRDLPSWLSVTAAGLTAAQRDGAVRASAALHVSLAVAHTIKGDPDEAVRHAGHGRRLSVRAGWPAGQLAARSLAAVLESRLGRSRSATRHFTAIVAEHRAAGNPSGAATTLNNLGVVRTLTSHLDAAAEVLQEALTLHERSGSRLGAESARINLGVIHLHRGQLGRAHRCLADAAAGYERLGDIEGEAAAAGHLAVVQALQGDLRAALASAVAGLAALRSGADPAAEALVLHSLATVRLELGHHGTARRYLERALRLATVSQTAQGRVAALTGLAHADLAAGAPDRAGDHARAAAHLARACDYRQPAAVADTARALALLRTGDRDGAAELAGAAADTLRRLGCDLARGRALVVLREATGDERCTPVIDALLQETAPRYRRAVAS